uniref:Uncharacterized protein n=1 Tax=Populus davidiana TaxID=266767 RepID=A0A6M2EI87_9ROSI
MRMHILLVWRRETLTFAPARHFSFLLGHLARHANNADARVAPSLTSYYPKTSLLALIITIQSEILNIRGNASSLGYSTSYFSVQMSRLHFIKKIINHDSRDRETVYGDRIGSSCHRIQDKRNVIITSLITRYI